MENKPRVLYFIYCEAVETQILPGDVQKLKIVNPLNYIASEFIPGNYSYSVSLSIQGFDLSKQNELRIILTDEDGKTVNDTNPIILPGTQDVADGSLPCEYHGMQMNLDFRNVPFRKEGLYTSQLIFNGECLGAYSIGVVKVGDENENANK